MASRPFASVAVELEVGGNQEEPLQVRTNRHSNTLKKRKQTKSVLHLWKHTHTPLLFGGVASFVNSSELAFVDLCYAGKAEICINEV